MNILEIHRPSPVLLYKGACPVQVLGYSVRDQNSDAIADREAAVTIVLSREHKGPGRRPHVLSTKHPLPGKTCRGRKERSLIAGCSEGACAHLTTAVVGA